MSRDCGVPGYASAPIVRLRDGLPAAAVPPGASDRKVIVLGLDGLRPDILLKAVAPRLQALAATGLLAVSPLYCSPGGVTGSGAGWATVLGGVWPAKSLLRNGNMLLQRVHRYPDFLTRAKQYDERLSTAVVASWSAIASRRPYGGPMISDAVDERVSFDCDSDDPDDVDAAVTDVTVGLLGEHNPDLLFVHLGGIDIAGHHGGASLPHYYDTISLVDRQVGRILDALAARPDRADWLVLATNDHGHQDIGYAHNGPSAAERGWFLIANGPAVQPGRRYDVRTVDVTPTVLHHLGIPNNPVWGLDGRAVQDPTPADPFDTTVPRLVPAFDPLLIPNGTAGGVTGDPPESWSVEPPTDAAWGGWRFVTDPYWSAQQPQAGRETFVHARGAFAVADAVLAGIDSFDSTLVSQAYDISGGNAVTVEFSSHYRQQDNGFATVTASYDGGAEYTIVSYGPGVADANHGCDVVSTRESVRLTPPAGSSRLVLRWRLRDGGWFAIDDVRVTPGHHPRLGIAIEPAIAQPGDHLEVHATIDGDPVVDPEWTLTADLPWPVSGTAESGHWQVAVPPDIGPASCWLSVGARWGEGGATTDFTVAVPYDDVAAARNCMVTSLDSTPEHADADGTGSSWSSEALASAGVSPGAPIGPFSWPSALPGENDAILCRGQAIRINGRGARLSLLAASAFFPGGGDGVIVYADGVRQPYDIFIPSWECPAEDAPHPVLASTTIRNDAKHGPQERLTNLFRIDIPVRPDVDVAAIILPWCSARPTSYAPNPYVFDIVATY